MNMSRIVRLIAMKNREKIAPTFGSLAVAWIWR
ncbi:MAG: hypothetical protein JWP74_3482 [Marmoricola sp.]|nr:hypothetical protein [Marmoricola sp.]